MPSTDTLRGQTVLVTGAARRLGRRIALALAERGAHIVVHYHTSATDAERLVEEIEALGTKAYGVQGNLGRSEEPERLFAHVLETAGPVDVLINSASMYTEEGIGDVTADSLATNVNVNALAPFLLSRSFAGQQREGSIVNFLDTRIMDYDKSHVSYHLSKRMLFSITRMMALEFAPKVRVNAIAPGLILPPEGKDETYLKELAPTNPLQTYGGPVDIVEAVLFLLGGRYITGQVIYVDGGRHMLGGAYG